MALAQTFRADPTHIGKLYRHRSLCLPKRLDRGRPGGTHQWAEIVSDLRAQPVEKRRNTCDADAAAQLPEQVEHSRRLAELFAGELAEHRRIDRHEETA